MEFSDSSFMVVADSDTTIAKLEWINPTTLLFKPSDGWAEKKDYELITVSSELIPIEGQSFKDSLLYLNIKSGKKIGYGGLKGSIELDSKLGLIELQSLKNK